MTLIRRDITINHIYAGCGSYAALIGICTSNDMHNNGTPALEYGVGWANEVGLLAS
jgi:hypothetical protein